MRSAALEYTKNGTIINTVQPGNVLTEGLIAQGQSYLNEMKKTVPIHRELLGILAQLTPSLHQKKLTTTLSDKDCGQILPESFDAIL